MLRMTADSATSRQQVIDFHRNSAFRGVDGSDADIAILPWLRREMLTICKTCIRGHLMRKRVTGRWRKWPPFESSNFDQTAQVDRLQRVPGRCAPGKCRQAPLAIPIFVPTLSYNGFWFNFSLSDLFSTKHAFLDFIFNIFYISS